MILVELTGEAQRGERKVENMEQPNMTWQEITCMDGRICLKLPEGWQRAPDEVTEKKFPYRQRPQEVFSAPDISRLLTLNILEKQMPEKQVFSAILAIQRAIGHLYPGSIREAAQAVRADMGMAGYFSFVTGGSTRRPVI